ncbi:Rap guanine nucleotide exchange factor 2 [Exaiptasia diaphana]|nr:Rap guanine nucleotide exchange factor 2 [Exaiptasia diaphana]
MIICDEESSREPQAMKEVTRVMLLWVNNHFTDFEGDTDMENFLESFEKGLELQKMSGQLDLLNMACSAKAKTREVSLERPSRNQSWGFAIIGGKELSFPIFVSKVEEESQAYEKGVRRGDQYFSHRSNRFWMRTRKPLKISAMIRLSIGWFCILYLVFALLKKHILSAETSKAVKSKSK